MPRYNVTLTGVTDEGDPLSQNWVTNGDEISVMTAVSQILGHKRDDADVSLPWARDGFRPFNGEIVISEVSE